MVNQSCPSGSVPYIIRRGDTLSLIAKLYQSTVDDIQGINPNLNPNNLQIGKQICIPLKIQLYPSCSTTNYYIVEKKDSFQSIANYFNVSYQQLYHANYGINPDDLYEDQVLCIPVAPPPVEISIDINQRELSLIQNEVIISTYQIAKENPNFPIPRGTFIILNKQVDPGVEYGARWLGLSRPGFGIHGINTPQFIEKIATDNNIILTNKDISTIFNLVTVGTRVTII